MNLTTRHCRSAAPHQVPPNRQSETPPTSECSGPLSNMGSVTYKITYIYGSDENLRQLQKFFCNLIKVKPTNLYQNEVHVVKTCPPPIYTDIAFPKPRNHIPSKQYLYNNNNFYNEYTLPNLKYAHYLNTPSQHSDHHGKTCKLIEHIFFLHGFH